MGHGIKVKDVTPNEFNNLIETFEDMGTVKYTIKEETWSVKLITKSNTYRCKLGSEDLISADPSTVSKKFHKITNYHYIENDPELAKLYGYKQVKNGDKVRIKWKIATANGIMYTNNKYALKPLKCFGYDLNSAYSWAMLQKMPDTRQLPKINDIVGENEIGFFINGKATITPGVVANYIFPLMESPFKDYVYEYYKLKQSEGTNSLKRKMWKDWLNFPTGILQRHNIFLRNAVIMYNNKLIESLIDENTVYCNTDSIVSLKRRPDLEIGNEIGQFKEEHINQKFKFKQEGIYQWDNECHYKGINGKCITDIEKTDGWFKKRISNLPYKYNKEIMRIEKNG